MPPSRLKGPSLRFKNKTREFAPIEDESEAKELLKNSDLMAQEPSKDMCPICKTDRYLSPSMIFKINPECYHKMCESCVDRIFALGLTQCPYPGCNKILRKNKFKKQVFDDLEIEKEVDTRKKIMEIYNKPEEAFAELQAYNAYLEEIESIIFNFINSVDLDETQEKVTKYQQENEQVIHKQNMINTSNVMKFNDNMKFLNDLKVQKQKLQKQISEDELNLIKLTQMEILNDMDDQAAHNASILDNVTIAKSKESVIKRSSARKRKLEEISNAITHSATNLSGTSGSGNNKRKLAGKQEEEEEEELAPFTPFVGDRYDNFISVQREFKSMRTLQDEENSGSRFVIDDETELFYDPVMYGLFESKKEFRASGYKINNFFNKALMDCNFGLNCIISVEK
ncbi:hypothetical protein BABINDRAFT_163710 [Babjeviella inositovora NRRL Y-12698]|uniref:RNA polymerase II transcription factor B subunit 3 n=1 Tax=Babjeviella inositovora NRRL Y-12698 TaxID=984486 RepID=A0A1E3QJE7_9ASCO|nr:uncharacterized protein BABINDRAFT_163710 [Babjeviella inositovora NRRL Y-12698]ODQ77202.1 hypothetical protein BABINDRAFT_163710 [Babjeviella inositovora NRRL Y-12698]